MSELNAMEAALNEVLDVNVGDLVRGEVLTIQDNKQVIVGIVGAGVEGVIPAKELSKDPVENITDIVKVGDVMDLVVISTIKDKENGSYLLSKRRVDERLAWEELAAKIAEGQDIVEGTVTQVVRGGLVVDAGVRGFVPASLVAERFVRNLTPYKGQTLAFKVVEINPAERSLVLSRKELVAQEREEKLNAAYERLSVGETVDGVVSRLTNFGAFIDLGGVDGLVHISEIAHKHVKNPADVLKAGETVSVKILDIDREANRISLSIKATQPTPWEAAAEQLQENTAVKGIVKRLADFGAFVEVLPGVEGLVHISQVAHERIEKMADALQPGQEVDVLIQELRSGEKRLSLSIKALLEKPKSEVEEVEETVEEESYDVESENTTVTLGDVLGDSLQLEDE